jgi:hypothetical protein
LPKRHLSSKERKGVETVDVSSENELSQASDYLQGPSADRKDSRLMRHSDDAVQPQKTSQFVLVEIHNRPHGISDLSSVHWRMTYAAPPNTTTTTTTTAP